MGNCLPPKEEDDEDNWEGKYIDAKVIIVGPVFVGKTSIVQKLLEKKDDIEKSTISKEYEKIYQVKINTGNEKLRLKIWDTPGGDHFTKANV